MPLKSKQKFTKIVGKNIREIRLKKGISLKHFEAIDNSIDRHALSRIEQGKVSPTAFTLYKIAEVLEVDLTEFFKKLN